MATPVSTISSSTLAAPSAPAGPEADVAATQTIRSYTERPTAAYKQTDAPAPPASIGAHTATAPVTLPTSTTIHAERYSHGAGAVP